MRPDDLPQALPWRPHDWRKGDHLLALLAANASSHPAEIAMRERDRGIWREYTWQDYHDTVLAFAAGLEALGVRPFEVVQIIGDNRPALYFAMVALGALRAIASPAYPDATPDEIALLAEREDVRCAVVEDQEQVDKLLQLEKEHGERYRLIVYDDPRGLAGKMPERFVAFTDVVARGRERLAADPLLRQALLERPSAHDVAVLLHSSGTTGTPKGVPLKHGHVLSAVRNAAQAGYFQNGDVHVAYLPMAWVGDYIFSIGAAFALRFAVNIPERQETVIRDLREIAPTVFFSSPRAWAGMITRIQVGMDESTPLKRRLYEHFMAFAIDLERRRLAGNPPSLGARLWRTLGEWMIYGPIKDQLGLARVRRAYTAGEAIGEDDFLFLRALGVPLRQFYGQTENCALCAAQSADDVKLHTVGRPFPGVEVKIADSGEILVRGDNVFDGYYDNPKASEESLEDGWLHTGDAGYFEEDGSLVVLGRLSEVAYTAAGERYVATYIENRIKFSQYVKDVCVVGENRPFLTAIVCIDLEAVGHWAEEHGVPYTSYADLSQKPEVYDLVARVIAHVNNVLPSGLRIRRFVNLHKPFDPDDGEVTRTRKLRRKVIYDRYAPILEALYDPARREIDFQATITYETGETGVIARRLRLYDVAPAQGE